MNTAADNGRGLVVLHQREAPGEPVVISNPDMGVHNGFVNAQLTAHCSNQWLCATCPQNPGWHSECLFKLHCRGVELFNKALIPATFVQATMETLLNEHHRSPSILQSVNWIRAWCHKDPLPERGLLLSGPNGAGKSFALAALARHLTLNRRIACLFVDFGQFLLRLKECYTLKNNDGELLDKLRNPEVLILDDVGSSRDTEWSRDIFQTIIAFRYNDCARTFITTNLSLTTATRGAASPFTKWAGAHSSSRLKQLCHGSTFCGPDRRGDDSP